MGEVLGRQIPEAAAVNTEEARNAFRELLACYGRGDEGVSQLLLYHQLLCEWNTRMNLTGNTDLSVMLAAHYADSLAPLAIEGLFPQNARLIDVGSGAGFPGVPLAIARPDLRITLLDSLQKRVRFLEAVKEACGLANVQVRWGRAEDAAHDDKLREQYDIAAARAVAPSHVLCELLLPFVRVGGKMVCYKGPAAEEELALAKRAAFLLGGGVPQVIPVSVTGEEEWKHCVLVSEKNKAAPAQYPRKAGTPQKKPLGE